MNQCQMTHSPPHEELHEAGPHTGDRTQPCISMHRVVRYFGEPFAWEEHSLYVSDPRYIRNVPLIFIERRVAAVRKCQMAWHSA